ncbi:MAG: hypothetical protein R6V29_05660 [Spirochaetia bacterium]
MLSSKHYEILDVDEQAGLDELACNLRLEREPEGGGEHVTSR